MIQIEMFSTHGTDTEVTSAETIKHFYHYQLFNLVFDVQKLSPAYCYLLSGSFVVFGTGDPFSP